MSATIKFMDALAARYNATDYRIGKMLGKSTGAISNYRTGRSTFDAKTCVQVAELLELEPLEVIAAVEADRARTEDDRGWWRAQLKRIAIPTTVPAVAAALVAGALLSPGEARAVSLNPAGPSMYIMLSRMRAWFRGLAYAFAPIQFA